MPRTLAIGDIHGCSTALETLLAEVRIVRDDTLVILGDVIDRGPDSKRVVDVLLDLEKFCRLEFIQGNHEEMILSAFGDGEWALSWTMYGGHETIASYGGPDRIPEAHFDFFRRGKAWFETERDIFVHANLEPGVPLASQSPEWLRWTHLTGMEKPWPTGQRVIVGHTPQRDGTPLVEMGWVGIDTFACGGAWLTCLNVETNEFWQASESGNLRQGTLH